MNGSGQDGRPEFCVFETILVGIDFYFTVSEHLLVIARKMEVFGENCSVYRHVAGKDGRGNRV